MSFLLALLPQLVVASTAGLVDLALSPRRAFWPYDPLVTGLSSNNHFQLRRLRRSLPALFGTLALYGNLALFDGRAW